MTGCICHNYTITWQNGTSFQFVNKNVFSKQYFFDSVNMTNYLQVNFLNFYLGQVITYVKFDTSKPQVLLKSLEFWKIIETANRF